LYGVPGTGKSHLAKTIAQELGISFIEAPAPYFADKFVGESAQRIKQLFDTAKKMEKPVLIFIDEIDAIATNRTGSTHEEHKALLTALLNELQDIQNDYNIYVIAATNVNPHDKEEPMKPRKTLLDPAVISRFGTATCEIKPLDKGGKTKLLLKLFKDYNIDARCTQCNHETCSRGNMESINTTLAGRLADVLNSNFSNRDIESVIICAQLKRKNALLMEPGNVKHFCHYIKEAIDDSGKSASFAIFASTFCAGI
jgi:SpoVK/Ycf46/Vps4 family AAA+-type ATPase